MYPLTKVLVVDDEPSVLQSTGLLLSELGYEVVTTNDPADVVQLVRKERPDVVLQDVRMPGLDLEALIKNIRTDPDVGRSSPPIIVSRVVFPEPEGPMMSTISPRRTVRSTPSTARTAASPSPNTFVRPLAARTTSSVLCVPYLSAFIMGAAMP